MGEKRWGTGSSSPWSYEAAVCYHKASLRRVGDSGRSALLTAPVDTGLAWGPSASSQRSDAPDADASRRPYAQPRFAPSPRKNHRFEGYHRTSRRSRNADRVKREYPRCVELRVNHLLRFELEVCQWCLVGLRFPLVIIEIGVVDVGLYIYTVVFWNRIELLEVSNPIGQLTIWAENDQVRFCSKVLNRINRWSNLTLQNGLISLWINLKLSVRINQRI